jgi:hypothetical protein
MRKAGITFLEGMFYGLIPVLWLLVLCYWW